MNFIDACLTEAVPWDKRWWKCKYIDHLLRNNKNQTNKTLVDMRRHWKTFHFLYIWIFFGVKMFQTLSIPFHVPPFLKCLENMYPTTYRNECKKKYRTGICKLHFVCTSQTIFICQCACVCVCYEDGSTELLFAITYKRAFPSKLRYCCYYIESFIFVLVLGNMYNNNGIGKYALCLDERKTTTNERKVNVLRSP